LETVVRGHGDSNNLSLIAHLGSNEHEGQKNVSRGSGNGTAAAEVLDLLSSELHSLERVMVTLIEASFSVFNGGLGSRRGVSALSGDRPRLGTFISFILDNVSGLGFLNLLFFGFRGGARVSTIIFGRRRRFVTTFFLVVGLIRFRFFAGARASGFRVGFFSFSIFVLVGALFGNNSERVSSLTKSFVHVFTVSVIAGQDEESESNAEE
jgi:hypothetical protein